ncbi:MAG: hypothetical protein LBI86_02860 [Treponema sp.]|jgi:hypothetical protein|nr:hypothetical protein [Treponema sp.]
MMNALKPDIPAFATMPHIRIPLVEPAVKYRVKGLLFEKPMAISLNEAAVCHQHTYLRPMGLCVGRMQRPLCVFYRQDRGRKHTGAFKAETWSRNLPEILAVCKA